MAPPAQPDSPRLGSLLAKYTRQDSNLQPSVPKTDALSNCATGALSHLSGSGTLGEVGSAGRRKSRSGLIFQVQSPPAAVGSLRGNAFFWLTHLERAIGRADYYLST